VIHALSAHGPVEVTTVGNSSTTSLTCAPFENRVYLFAVPGGTTEAGLLLHSGLQINAKAADGSYTLRMSGRAHAGRLLSSHRERSALEPWAPDGVPMGRVLVIPFTAEEIEYLIGTGDEAERFAGKTPQGIGRDSTAREYLRAALSGLALPMVIWTVLITVVWLIVQGVHYQGREIACGLAVLGSGGLIGGLRLIYVSIAYGLWRKGQARAEDASVLSEGLIAPGQARRMAATVLGLSALSLLALALLWGSKIVGVVVGSTGVWLIVPAWALHLLMRQPEAQK